MTLFDRQIDHRINIENGHHSAIGECFAAILFSSQQRQALEMS